MIVKFNKETSRIYDEKAEVYNQLLLENVGHYFEDLIIAKGYVYYSEIYEELGVEWDPTNDNLAFLKEDGKYLNFKINETDEGYTIEFNMK